MMRILRQARAASLCCAGQVAQVIRPTGRPWESTAERDINDHIMLL